jgi:hypothetical protein
MTVFLLHPEPIWSKLFFSFLGGSVNCALDSAVPLMAGSIAAGFSPFRGLMYLPVLMAVDFFASTSGTFTDVSVPASIGVSFKQVIQVLLEGNSIVVSNLIALVSYIAKGSILYEIAIPASIANILGSYLGAYLAVRNGKRLVKWVLYLVTAVLIVQAVLKLI